MVTTINLKDNSLKNVLKTKIVQKDNYNSNSELFIYNDLVLKIYDDSIYSSFNIDVINKINTRKSFLNNIEELVLPKDLVIYNNRIVGFSMPYIEGITLDTIIEEELYSEEEMKKIFFSILDIINKFSSLPFSFFIGDLHEKNIIIDKNFKNNIIDSDSFIIDNNKLFVNGNYLVGKYVNHYYNNSELEQINLTADYYSLLCIVLNYLFKGIIDDVSNPVSSLKRNSQFNELFTILENVDKNFILSKDDINKIFNFKKTLKYQYKENKELIKLIKKIRNKKIIHK